LLRSTQLPHEAAGLRLSNERRQCATGIAKATGIPLGFWQAFVGGLRSGFAFLHNALSFDGARSHSPGVAAVETSAIELIAAIVEMKRRNQRRSFCSDSSVQFVPLDTSPLSK
jgi:hypothetical protein